MAGRAAPKLETFDWPRDRGNVPRERRCAWDGCDQPGDHRAPKSRDSLNDYQWLCLDHAREFNRAWNYYQGMSDDEVEADLRRDTTWNRPTWRLGGNGAFRPDKLADPLGLFGEHGPGGAPAGGGQPPVRPPISREEERAYATLGLEYPVTADNLKTRYKVLVKEYHPDANPGDSTAEDRLKDINAAYRLLRDAVNA
ncbi:MAG: DnaJ domain-containing protein [Rhodospirillales bacterium]